MRLIILYRRIQTRVTLPNRKPTAENAYTFKVPSSIQESLFRSIYREMHFSAAELDRDLKLDPNDALAIEAMSLNETKKIYSFDSDFDGVEG